MKITLCGSARFEDLFHTWNQRLTMEGHVVYGLAVYPSVHGGTKEWYTEDQKTMLDLVHLAKIEESSAILVLNRDGYIGESTAREVRWARIRNRLVFYLEGGGIENVENLYYLCDETSERPSPLQQSYSPQPA